MKKLALLLVAVTVTIAVGCTSSESSTADSSDVEQLVDLMTGGPAGYEVAIQRDKLQEDLIVGCMKASGFEYFPAVFESPVDENAEERTDYGWVEGFRTVAEQGSSGNVVQVDATIGLSEAETEAYVIALGLDGDEEGCWATTRAAADAALGLDRLMPLAEEASVGIREWKASGAMSALNEEWTLCMRESGLEISGEQDLVRMVQNRWNELVEAGQDDSPALKLESSIFEADSECSVERDEFYQNYLREAAEAVLTE